MWRWGRCSRRIKMKGRRVSVVVSEFRGEIDGGAPPPPVCETEQTRENPCEAPEHRRKPRQKMRDNRISYGDEKDKLPLPFLENFENPAVPVVTKVSINVHCASGLFFATGLDLLSASFCPIKPVEYFGAERPGIHVAKTSSISVLNISHPPFRNASIHNLTV